MNSTRKLLGDNDFEKSDFKNSLRHSRNPTIEEVKEEEFERGDF
jgi:hypothetical protein